MQGGNANLPLSDIQQRLERKQLTAVGAADQCCPFLADQMVKLNKSNNNINNWTIGTKTKTTAGEVKVDKCTENSAIGCDSEWHLKDFDCTDQIHASAASWKISLKIINLKTEKCFSKVQMIKKTV